MKIKNQQKFNNVKILLTLLFLIFSSCCYAINSNEELSKMEDSIFGFSYSNDDAQKRLSRIETNVLGVVNSKLTIEQRIKKLNEAMGFETIEESQKPAYELNQEEVAGINYPQIDSLEYQLFQTTYEKENIYKRLERLETKLFGSVQDGALSSRTERLKAYINKDQVAQNPYSSPYQYNQRPYSPTDDVSRYMGSQSKYDNSDIHIQLAGLESILFSKTYSQDPVGLRLNRLERKIFQRDFSSDDDYLRIQRLQAAASAQQTAKIYEANKFQKYASTGMQIGSIILMILALIL